MHVESCIIAFSLGVFTFSLFSFKSFAIFQQCSYRIGEFLFAIFRERCDEICRLLTYSLAFGLILPFSGLAVKLGQVYFAVVFACVCIIFSGIYFCKSEIIKPPKFTRRYVRIFCTSALMYGLYTVAVLYLASSLRYGVYIFLIAFALLTVLSPFFICLGKTVNYPYDKIRYELSKLICNRRLNKSAGLIKIGITGSFGKTSVKNYLASMLSVKYKVLSTPKSFNTPLGICRAVKGIDTNCDVFIAEMGARYKNDIKELCKIVCPSIGVVTGIAGQHTATLGDIDGVKRAKNQLIEALPQSGFAVFSSQTPKSQQMFEEAKCLKYSVGRDMKDYVYYRNFKQYKDGIRFEIVVAEVGYRTFAPLLGEHNATNICLAAAVALRLGIKIEQILSVIPTLRAVEHRAEMTVTNNGITVIDDGYNGNIDGITSTARAVDCIDGYKIAITSGVVEVGKNSRQINYEVGRILSRHFNLVVAVGVNSSAIKEGAEKQAEVICVGKTQETADIIQKRAKSGDVVAFFNDLPDRY